jgi:UDP-glucuronate 4-epimerase
MRRMRVLVTGCAGFIGAATAHALLDRGDDVVGLDNMNAYYEPALKEARLERLRAKPGFAFVRADLADRDGVSAVFEGGAFDRVIHLGAQAGVRFSTENPAAFVDSNLVGTANVLEGCRRHGVRGLVFASTSSVYGLRTALPFRESTAASHPISLYSATKRANELMAHSYAHLFGLPCTGLRFFTVYGPWGRPDMALFKFTRSILAGEPIEIYNNGHHSRDFTYVDDVVAAVVAAADRPAAPDPAFRAAEPAEAASSAPWRLYNVGCGNPVPLLRYIELIEQCTGRQAVRRMLPAQPGDVADTYADTAALRRDLGVTPRVPVEEGVRRFVEWFRGYYRM